MSKLKTYWIRFQNLKSIYIEPVIVVASDIRYYVGYDRIIV